MITLLHGDCVEMMRTIPAGSVDLIATDLPYGTTRCKWDAIIPFPLLWDNVRRLLKPGGAFVTTASQPFTSSLIMSNLEWFRFDDVWRKSKPTGFLDCKKRPLRVHESIVVFSGGRLTFNPQMRKGLLHKRGRKKSNKKADVYDSFSDDNITWSDEYYPLSVCEFTGESKPEHPTQKPVDLFEYIVKTYSNPGETVLDPCMGSGTTGEACILTGRDFIGIEKERKYFDMASGRIEAIIPGTGVPQQTEMFS